MRKILTLTDFSDNSYNALECAHRFYKDDPCEIILLHSIEPQMSTSTSRIDYGKKVQVYEALSAEVEEEFEKFLARLPGLDNGKHTYRTELTTEELYKRVNSMIAEEDIDLVLMGTKGRTAARDIFMGSNTVKMVRSVVGCPVLTIPENHEYVPPVKFALATDFRRPIHERQLERLVGLAKYMSARLDILHIFDEGEQLTTEQLANKALLETNLEEVDYHYQWLPDTGVQKSKIIGEYTRDNGYHLLAMLFHKRSFFDRLFREKVIKRIGFHTDIPFMVIPELD